MSNSRKVLCTHLPQYNLAITSQPPRKYLPSDWKYSNEDKFRITKEQEKLSERVIADAQRVADETRETTISMKKEVDHNIEQRLTEMQFLIDELKRQKKSALLEEEALKVYRTRIQSAIDFLKEKSLLICQKCIIFRENRIGIDLVDDEVDRHLRQELKVIQGTRTGLMDKALQETNESIRRLRAAIYLLDRDMSNKDKALRIDQNNLFLRENQLEMSTYHGLAPLSICNYTLAEWTQLTHKNIENTDKEINSAKHLRSYIEILLKQLIEDLKNQTERTNEAFQKRINEVRYVKQCLEEKHKDIVNSINDVRQQIIEIEKELSNKEGYIALCQMRLASRAQRPELELTCDAVQDSLNNELNALENTVKKLNQKYIELKATLRYLLHSQMLQEEELNIKLNSLKIDETDCMTIRQGLIYQSF